MLLEGSYVSVPSSPAVTQHLAPEEVGWRMRLPQPSSTGTCSARDGSAELPPGSELEDFHITKAT